MEQLGSHQMDCHEIWYLSIFLKYVKKIQVSLKSDKNKSYFPLIQIYVFDHISQNSCLNEKGFRQNMFKKKKNQKHAFN